MAHYRIHRMKDTPRESFRWAAHSGGLSIVKPKDYEAGEDLEAVSPYVAWKVMTESENPLRPGDLLESLSSEGAPVGLQIVKYIGFEPAQWYTAQAKPDSAADPAPGETELVNAESSSAESGN